MKDFNTQFKEQKNISIGNNKVYFVDIIPNELKFDIPIMIAPGWGGTPKSFKDVIKCLFDEGFRVICVNHIRHDMKLITKEGISRLEFQKADSLVSIIKHLGINKINIVAHSEGAINAIIAVQNNRDLFSKMILIGPGGIVDKEPFIELLSRFIGNILLSSVSTFGDIKAIVRFFRSGVEILKYFSKNPMMGLLEGSAISHSHMKTNLNGLHSTGMYIGMIHGTEDIVFPLNKIMESIKDIPWIDLYQVVGDHSGIYIHPEVYVSIIKKNFSDII